MHRIPSERKRGSDITRRGALHWLGAAAGAAGIAPAARADAPPTGADLPYYVPVEPPWPVPDVSFVAADGNRVALSEYRGLVVVLNFWASWCAPCVHEMPSLDELAAISNGKGYVVLTVSEDDAMAPAVRFLTRFGLDNLPALLDPGGHGMDAFGGKALPTTYIIDPRGQLRGLVEGIADWASPHARAVIAYYVNESDAVEF